MERDLRQMPRYLEVEAYLTSVLGPGFGRVQEPSDPAPTRDGARIAFTAHVLERLEGHEQGRVCLANADGSGWRQVTFGPNDDHGARWSTDGTRLTFLSDRGEKGRHRLYALDTDLGEATVLADIAGTVEYHAWSPDGGRILLGVAGLGAERADAMGSGTVGEEHHGEDPAWLPEIRTWQESPSERRRAWVLDVGAASAAPAGSEGLNVWEACWCGPDAVLAIVSEGADEGAWYGARLVRIDLSTGEHRDLLGSRVQLSFVTATDDGALAAVVEARCSDRYIAAGDLLLLDPATGDVRRVETDSVDITSFEWRDGGRLFAAGLRGLDSVFLEVDASSGTTHEVWSTPEASGGWYPAGTPIGDANGFVTTLSSSQSPPALVAVRGGEASPIAAFAHAGHEVVRAAIGRCERVEWTAPDGLTIQGLVYLPKGEGPFPLIVRVHGGPVAAYQDSWQGVLTAMQLERGYAIFCPNPRGSGGRGQAFIEMVVGDMGGADSHDVLGGVDHLVRTGVADPGRIGVYGGSYGGFMAAWLPAIDDRFKASVSVSPVTDWVSQHFTSSLAAWDAEFVGADPADPVAFGRHSPVMRAPHLRTPTLLTAGMHDRATPVGQAIELWQALRLQGVPAEVVIYPNEGHGVRDFPALTDFLTRVIGWFDTYLPAG